jgi:hypothetical protein
MSNHGSEKAGALNWRGALLAGAIFAGVFGVLLLMAHLNQSTTTDQGSSFREDPYGATLLFDAYRRAGYQVNRSDEEIRLADQDAASTTAFFVGGHEDSDFETRDGKMVQGAKFHALLEDFLERGGRAVLLQHEPGIRVAEIADSEDKPNSAERKWQKEKTWGVESEYPAPGKREFEPGWVAPQFPAMPARSEMMYVATDGPWLKIDAQWTSLYAGPVHSTDVTAIRENAGDAAPPRVYMAMRRVGNGEVVVASQESFLLNEAIKTHPNPVLLDFLAGGRPVIWVDEALHGFHQEQGVLWLVQRYRLQTALLLFWATLLVLLWSMSGDLVRRPARDPSDAVIRYGEAPGVAGRRILQRTIAPEQVVAECWEQFRRRSPHDAQPISADPRWGPRLRAALAQPPLAGYKELSRLIAERRTSAKGLARAERKMSTSSVALPKSISQEAQII